MTLDQNDVETLLGYTRSIDAEIRALREATNLQSMIIAASMIMDTNSKMYVGKMLFHKVEMFVPNFMEKALDELSTLTDFDKED